MTKETRHLNQFDRDVRGYVPERTLVVRTRYRLRFVPRSPLNVVQMLAKAVSGQPSSSSKLTASLFLVSGLSQPSQCSYVVLPMFMDPLVRGGSDIPQRIIASSVPSVLRTTAPGAPGKTPGIGARLPT